MVLLHPLCPLHPLHPLYPLHSLYPIYPLHSLHPLHFLHSLHPLRHVHPIHPLHSLYVVNTYSITSTRNKSVQGTICPLSNLTRTESRALNATKGHKCSYQNPATNLTSIRIAQISLSCCGSLGKKTSIAPSTQDHLIPGLINS